MSPMTEHGNVSLLITAADIFVIIKILKSPESTGLKAIWIIVVVLLPFIGLIAWYFVGPGEKSLSL